MYDILVDERFLELLKVVGLAVLLGGAIGMEREVKGRSAGFRTNILVCLGSALVMLVSKQLEQLSLLDPGGRHHFPIDPGRVAAGVLTGVGFLGAGAIVKTGDVVRGLTTAASIWLMTGLGVAVGLGFYVEAVTTTAVALIVLNVATRVDALIRSNEYYSITVCLPTERAAAGEDRILTILRALPGAAAHVTRRRVDLADQTTGLTFYLRTRGHADSKGVTAAITGVGGVQRVTWR